MINKIPVLGWILSFLASVSLSIPFYFIWNALAPVYLYQLPDVYLHIPFWHCVGLFIVIPIVKTTFTPSFVAISQHNSQNVGQKEEKDNVSRLAS